MITILAQENIDIPHFYRLIGYDMIKEYSLQQFSETIQSVIVQKRYLMMLNESGNVGSCIVFDKLRVAPV